MWGRRCRLPFRRGTRIWRKGRRAPPAPHRGASEPKTGSPRTMQIAGSRKGAEGYTEQDPELQNDIVGGTMKMRSYCGSIAIFSLAALAACSRTTPIPHLRKQGTATQLIVDGQPFLAMA